MAARIIPKVINFTSSEKSNCVHLICCVFLACVHRVNGGQGLPCQHHALLYPSGEKLLSHMALVHVYNRVRRQNSQALYICNTIDENKLKLFYARNACVHLVAHACSAIVRMNSRSWCSRTSRMSMPTQRLPDFSSTKLNQSTPKSSRPWTACSEKS